MRYTETHEWIHLDGEIAVCGISRFAQDELGEVVYLELPEIGRVVEAGEEIAVLESTKAAADIYTPVSGKITEVNESLRENLAPLNEACEQEGWLFKIAPASRSELDSLLDQEQYLQLIS